MPEGAITFQIIDKMLLTDNLKYMVYLPKLTSINSRRFRELMASLKERVAGPPWNVSITYDTAVSYVEIAPNLPAENKLSVQLSLNSTRIDAYIASSIAASSQAADATYSLDEALLIFPLAVEVSPETARHEVDTIELLVSFVEAFATGGIGLAVGDVGNDLPGTELCRLVDPSDGMYETYVLNLGGENGFDGDYTFLAVSNARPTMLDRRFIFGEGYMEAGEPFVPARHIYRRTKIINGVITPPNAPFVDPPRGDGYIYFEESAH
jgi:hypothetical protein